MKTFAFKKIDAFATQNSGGNPAGVIYLDTGQIISVQEMQRIARELKGFVSEVGYVRQLDETSFDLKYYSAEREVDFCGHATVAIMYDLVKNNAALIHKQTLKIVTNKGTLIVENRIMQQDAVFISAPNPTFMSWNVAKQDLAQALNISPDDINDAFPTSIVNAGLQTLIVPINTLQATLTVLPRLETLKQFCQDNAIDIITMFTDEVADKSNAYRTRIFAPTFGYLEDPATGSGNAAFGHYLLQNGQWDGKSMALEQNGEYAKPNIVKLATKFDEQSESQVIFGGGAIVRIEGTYFLI